MPALVGVVEARRPRSITTATTADTRMTILLVEDDESIRELLSWALASYGFDVILAASAEEAETLVRDGAPRLALIVSDVCLPGASGLELARRLASICPDLRWLLISGDPAVESVIHQEDLRAGFLAKPFRTSTLIDRVRALVVRPASR
ncbi:MAG: response regulator [Vicinamibacterales bacterium]